MSLATDKIVAEDDTSTGYAHLAFVSDSVSLIPSISTLRKHWSVWSNCHIVCSVTFILYHLHRFAVGGCPSVTTESMKVFFLYTYAACLCNAYLPFYRYKPYLSSNECLSYIPSFLRGVFFFFFFFSVCIAQSFFTSLEHKHFLYENVNCSVVLFVYSHLWWEQQFKIIVSPPVPFNACISRAGS